MGAAMVEQVPGPEGAQTYLAFISYRHADNRAAGRQWATWLHQAIETYEVPADLVGKPLPGDADLGGAIPARIYPIFRDEDELPADADLGSSITGALDRSNLLIVLCSPRAVESTYVADEIDYFKKLGRSGRIIAAIIDGEPNASWDAGKQAAGFTAADECFPVPLQFEYADGERTDKRAEPIAADFRLNAGSGKPSEGWTTPEAYRQALKADGITGADAAARVEAYEKQLHLMLLKIIAGILGVPLSDLTKRDKEYQLALERERARKLRRWLAAVAMLAVAAVGAGTFAYFKQQEAERNEALAVAERDKANALLDQVRENMLFMNYQLRETIEHYVPSSKKVDLFRRMDELAALLEVYGTEDNDERERAMLLVHKVEVVLQSSDLDAAEALPIAEEALAILRRLLASNPNDRNARRDLVVVQTTLGEIYNRQNRLADARDMYERGLETATVLSDEFLDDMELLRDRAVLRNKIGDIYVKQMQYREALLSYRISLKIRQSLAEANPEHDGLKRDLYVIHKSIGDILLEQNKPDEALASYNAGHAILVALSNADPQHTGHLRDLSLILLDIGSVHQFVLRHTQALEAYRKGLEIRQKLLAADPSNILFQQGMAVVQERMGIILMDQGDHQAAEEAFARNNSILKTIVAAEPNNAVALKFLATGYANRADNHVRRGNGAAAMAALEESIRIRKKLLHASPEDVELWRGISLSHSKIGDIHMNAGQHGKALEAFQYSLEQIEPLAAAAPQSGRIQLLLFLSHYNIYRAHAALGRLPDAMAAAQAARGILADLEARKMLTPEDLGFIGMMEEIIADLQSRGVRPLSSPS